MKEIIIKAGKIELKAVLYNTPTAEIIYNNLPLEGKTSIWGDEVYFNIEFYIKPESEAREEVEEGELGYWPLGPAFCIFFGPTPVSIGNKPRAYSPVNVFGKISKNYHLLKGIENNEVIKVIKI